MYKLSIVIFVNRHFVTGIYKNIWHIFERRQFTDGSPEGVSLMDEANKLIAQNCMEQF